MGFAMGFSVMGPTALVGSLAQEWAVEFSDANLALVVLGGILGTLFHMWKWWAVPLMLLKEWMIPFVAQRTKSATPALVIHFVSNGVGVLLAILPLLTA